MLPPITPNQALERTATRPRVPISRGLGAFTAAHVRSRWPSLILFSLDVFAMTTTRVLLASLLLVIFSSCKPSPDSKYSRDMDQRLLPLQREEAETAAALYQETLRGGGDPKLSPQMRQALLDEQRQDAEIKSMVYHETLRRVQRSSTISPPPH